MVSQNCNIGTVCPTYYHVLNDEFYENRSNVMHTITYKLCHSYYNWSGTTRIPSVVQYAKKLAFLTGQYLHEAPESRMPDEKQLFFL
jgi:aubergine